ncbi:unnamed protein product [Cladocopium goreaui]|uniref:Uncharacterized protein n=1 Tax=Cladocopium goreaui TaxID=2562237 RepID=A0A9P1FNJ1_9DINO|nr:unnamed protein product [Cladocopium goreaui]
MNELSDGRFGESLPSAHVSAGFHYPVRPQYSTLHLQIRVNSGNVCPGEGRGVDLFRLHHRLKLDPTCFQRDDEELSYEDRQRTQDAKKNAVWRVVIYSTDTRHTTRTRCVPCKAINQGLIR